MRNAFWLLATFLVALLFVGLCSGGPVHRFHEVRGDAILAQDLTGDGIWDLVITNGSGLNVFKRNKRGHLAKPVGYVLEQGLAAKLTLADINGDSRPDIVANTGQVFLGEGEGFSSSVLTLPKTTRWLAADINGDKETDLVTVDLTTRGGKTEYRIVAILNLTEALDGKKIRVKKVGVTDSVVKEFRLSDLNGDGAPDLVALLPTSESPVQIFHNKLESGDGFQLSIKYPAASASGLRVHDLNSDGHPDLIVTASERSELRFLLQDGQGQFGDKGVLKTPGPPRSVAAGQLDDDGHPDLAVVCYAAGVGQTSEEVVLFKGDGQGRFEELDRWKTHRNPAVVEVMDLEGQAPDDVLVLGEDAELESFLQKD